MPPLLLGASTLGFGAPGSALRCTPPLLGAPALVWHNTLSRRCPPLLGRHPHVGLRGPHPGSRAFLILHKLQCREEKGRRELLIF